MGHLSHQMSIIRCSFAFGDNYIPFQIPIPYEKVAENSRRSYLCGDWHINCIFNI